jgi:hypothetical protein
MGSKVSGTAMSETHALTRNGPKVSISEAITLIRSNFAPYCLEEGNETIDQENDDFLAPSIHLELSDFTQFAVRPGLVILRTMTTKLCRHLFFKISSLPAEGRRGRAPRDDAGFQN